MKSCLWTFKFWQLVVFWQAFFDNRLFFIRIFNKIPELLFLYLVLAAQTFWQYLRVRIDISFLFVYSSRGGNFSPAIFEFLVMAKEAFGVYQQPMGLYVFRNYTLRYPSPLYSKSNEASIKQFQNVWRYTLHKPVQQFVLKFLFKFKKIPQCPKSQ